MEISELAARFGGRRELQVKGIFSSLFIAGNRLQTLFDNDSPDISLKQFMLLTMVRQAKEELTFTQLGKLLGCSRQNVKKLAAVLEQKGFVQICKGSKDVRAAVILPTEKQEPYFARIADHNEQKLAALFADYTDEEIAHFYALFMKLYEGLEKLETEDKTKGGPSNE